MSAGADREELLRRWHEATRHRERAELEAQLWASLSAEERAAARGRRGHGAASVLARMLGARTTVLRARSMLLQSGLAGELFQLVDSGEMRLFTAYKLLRRARWAAFSGRTRGRPTKTASAQLSAGLDHELRRQLAAWQCAPQVRVRTGGRVVSARILPGKRARKKSTRPLWTEVRELLMERFARDFAGLDPPVLEGLLADVQASVEVLVQEVQQKVNRLRGKEGVLAAKRRLTRRSVLDACATLVMNPPKVGGPADLLRAKKRMRARARVLHPDVHGGHEETRAEFEAVLEAYRVLEAYNETLTKKEESHVNGSAGAAEAEGGGAAQEGQRSVEHASGGRPLQVQPEAQPR